jgi:hypothetical protein
MKDIIVIIIILAIVIGAIAKIVIEKRKGSKCIGCPYSKNGRCSINEDNKSCS